MAELTDIPTLSELENRLVLVPGLDAASLEAESIAVLGRKSGALTAVLRRIPELPPEERKSFGATVNALNMIEGEIKPVVNALQGDGDDWLDGKQLDALNEAKIVLADLPHYMVKARVVRQVYGQWPPARPA